VVSGAIVGDTVGLGVGDTDGLGVGDTVGLGVGDTVGLCVGDTVGGATVGSGVGDTVGLGVGATVGPGVGDSVGVGVGTVCLVVGHVSHVTGHFDLNFFFEHRFLFISILSHPTGLPEKRKSVVLSLHNFTHCPHVNGQALRTSIFFSHHLINFRFTCLQLLLVVPTRTLSTLSLHLSGSTGGKSHRSHVTGQLSCTFRFVLHKCLNLFFI